MRAHIERLEALSLAETPPDFLVGMRACIGALSDFLCSAAGGAVGADHLMAALVLVAAHAQLANGCAVLQFVKAVAQPREVSSELGYVLCTYECALYFLLTCTPDQFGPEGNSARLSSEIVADAAAAAAASERSARFSGRASERRDGSSASAAAPAATPAAPAPIFMPTTRTRGITQEDAYPLLEPEGFVLPQSPRASNA